MDGDHWITGSRIGPTPMGWMNLKVQGLRCPWETSWSPTEDLSTRSNLGSGQLGLDVLVLHPLRISKLARAREVEDRHLHVVHRFRQDV